MVVWAGALRCRRSSRPDCFVLVVVPRQSRRVVSSLSRGLRDDVDLAHHTVGPQQFKKARNNVLPRHDQNTVKKEMVSYDIQE
jgi:hypothetical protein